MILYFFVKTLMKLNDILNIYDSNFSRFGLTIAIDKTHTLAYNVSEDVMSSKSLISLRSQTIENISDTFYVMIFRVIRFFNTSNI